MKDRFSSLRNGFRLCLCCIGFALTGCDFTPYEDYYNQAIDYSRKGNYKEALYYSNKAIKQNPNIVDSYFLRADCHIELDRWDKAIMDYQAILKIEPQNTLALYSLGISHGRMEGYKEAISLLNRAMTSPGAKEYGQKAGEYYLESNWSKANQKNAMYKVEIQFARGQAYLSNHEYDNAIADFKKLIAEAHFEDYSYYNLGKAYLGKKDSINACMHFIESAKLGYDQAKEKLKEHCI